MIETSQEYIIEEKNELDKKITNLYGFIGSFQYDTEVDKKEQDRLHEQLYAMILYSEILEERILNFNK